MGDTTIAVPGADCSAATVEHTLEQLQELRSAVAGTTEGADSMAVRSRPSLELLEDICGAWTSPTKMVLAWHDAVRGKDLAIDAPVLCLVLASALSAIKNDPGGCDDPSVRCHTFVSDAIEYYTGARGARPADIDRIVAGPNSRVLATFFSLDGTTVDFNALRSADDAHSIHAVSVTILSLQLLNLIDGLPTF
jgi:hypothetical protein